MTFVVTSSTLSKVFYFLLFVQPSPSIIINGVMVVIVLLLLLLFVECWLLQGGLGRILRSHVQRNLMVLVAAAYLRWMDVM